MCAKTNLCAVGLEILKNIGLNQFSYVIPKIICFFDILLHISQSRFQIISNKLESKFQSGIKN